jgi:hypothetical protein
MAVRFWSFCHPEPGPELDSGSIDFSISFFWLMILGLKAPPCGRGSLLWGGGLLVEHLFGDTRCSGLVALLGFTGGF